MALYEEKRVRIIANMPEVHNAAKLLVYLRYTEICRILSAKAKTSAINRGKENSRYLIEKF